MKNVIEVKRLVKKYKNFVLGPIDVNIPSGCIIGLIGENGAGKTTFIKALLNIIKVDVGNVKIFGKDYLKEEDKIKEDIGVVLDNMFFSSNLKVKEINSIMKGVYKTWDEDLFFNYMNQFSLPIDKKIKNLSEGMKKKLEIATALSHHPKLLILDEPTSKLDPVVRSEILDIFMEFVSDENHSIIFSTHITSDLEYIADKIIFINDGKVIMDKYRVEILDSYGILKCDLDEFASIDKEDIISYKKNRYGYNILIENKDKLSKKYKKYVLDKISLDELMFLIIKGGK